jgi:hypothetical protein
VDYRKLDVYPQAKLLHLVAGSIRGNVAVRQFAGFPITTPRPASGSATETVPCPQCGSRLTYKISSQERTRRLRLGWITVALLGPLLMAFLIATSGQGEESPALPTALVVIGFFAAPAATIGGFVQWWKEDGVRPLALPPPSGPAAAVETLNEGRHAIGFPTTSRRTYTKAFYGRKPPTEAPAAPRL